MSQPYQKIFYGVYVTPEQAEALYERFENDESAVDVAIEQVCDDHDLTGVGCSISDYSFVLGIRLASWGQHQTQQVSLNDLCAANELARLKLHGQALADIRQLVGGELQLGTWIVSYTF